MFRWWVSSLRLCFLFFIFDLAHLPRVQTDQEVHETKCNRDFRDIEWYLALLFRNDHPVYSFEWQAEVVKKAEDDDSQKRRENEQYFESDFAEEWCELAIQQGHHYYEKWDERQDINAICNRHNPLHDREESALPSNFSCRLWLVEDVACEVGDF